MKMSLAEFLIRKREQKGWTQRQLAERAGYSQATIGRIEARLTEAPGMDVIYALAKALNLPIEHFFAAYKGIDPDAEAPAEPEDLDAQISEFSRRLNEMIQKRYEQALRNKGEKP